MTQSRLRGTSSFQTSHTGPPIESMLEKVREQHQWEIEALRVDQARREAALEEKFH